MQCLQNVLPAIVSHALATMPSRLCAAPLLAAWLVFSTAPLAAEPQSVSKDEAARWMQWVIPLPHEASIGSKTIVPADQVAITLAADASSLERQAANELAEVFQKEAGCKVPIGVNRGAASFEILLGTCGKDGAVGDRPVPGAAKLFSLPCKEQAYRIAPLGTNALALVGTRPEGVYYAANTLKQLLSRTLSKAGQMTLAAVSSRTFSESGGKTLATIPMADVTDWPDLAERGLWGGSSTEDIEWMTERKMNLVESHIQLSVDDKGRGQAVIPDGLIARSTRHAMRYVPIITHLDQLPKQVFAKYPELKAVGPKADAWRKKFSGEDPVCFSQPKVLDILADWLSCLARYPEVTDVNVWFAESDVPCACDKCAAGNSFVLQTQLVAKAEKIARRIKPDLRARILLTQGSYASNQQVLEAAPLETGATYYHCNFTFDSSRNPMIYPLLEKQAALGRRLGCTPQLTASYYATCPWSAPQFIKARMSEFASKRLIRLCGYVLPSNRLFDFNVNAIAEWSWNATGRSEREFSLAWATRRGLADPEKAADWAVTLGKAGWDVYGANVPFDWIFGNTGATFVQGQPPALGSGAFKYFPNHRHFDENLAACDRAMRLAEDLNDPSMIEETRVIRGLTQMLKGLYVVAKAAAIGKEQLTPVQRDDAAAALTLADRGSRDARDGLLAWAKLLQPSIVQPTGRFADTLNCLDPVVVQIAAATEKLGVPDPDRAYRPKRIAEWVGDDFAAGTKCTKTWDVTETVADAGRYQAAFHTKGNCSHARIKSVALASAPSKDPTRQTQESREVREAGTDGHPIYRLTLAKYDPKQRYFLVVELDGGAESVRCSGDVTLCKVREQ